MSRDESQDMQQASEVPGPDLLVWVRRVVRGVVRWATNPGDAPDLRLRRLIGLPLSLATILLFFLYASFYFAYSEAAAGWAAVPGSRPGL